MNLKLLPPMMAMAALTFCVGALLFTIRVRAVRSGKVKLKYFRTYNEGVSTALELKASQHFTNLFEIPVLFYVACMLGIFLPVQGNLIIAAAWIFFVSRIAHALAHIGPNRLLPRMISFFVGVFATIAMWATIALQSIEA
jgi:hypothetical protein